MGVSADPVDRQSQFDESNSLGFTLLSDPDRKIARSFGARRPGPLPSRRTSFVIDSDATVLQVIKSEVNMEVHADQALDALRRRHDTAPQSAEG